MLVINNNNMKSKKNYFSLISSAILITFLLIILPGCSNNETANSSLDKDLADSQKAVKEILEKAQNEWAEDAEIHELTSEVNSTYVNNQRIFNGYKEGKFISWIARLYSPEKKQVVMADWTYSRVTLEEPYDQEDPLFQSVESKIMSLNNLAEENSSVKIFQKAKDQGLNPKKYYYTMKITGPTTEAVSQETPIYTWHVYEKDPNNFDENMESLTVNTYTITQ